MLILGNEIILAKSFSLHLVDPKWNKCTLHKHTHTHMLTSPNTVWWFHVHNDGCVTPLMPPDDVHYNNNMAKMHSTCKKVAHIYINIYIYISLNHHIIQVCSSPSSSVSFDKICNFFVFPPPNIQAHREIRTDSWWRLSFRYSLYTSKQYDRS